MGYLSIRVTFFPNSDFCKLFLLLFGQYVEMHYAKKPLLAATCTLICILPWLTSDLTGLERSFNIPTNHPRKKQDKIWAILPLGNGGYSVIDSDSIETPALPTLQGSSTWWHVWWACLNISRHRFLLSVKESEIHYSLVPYIAGIVAYVRYMLTEIAV